MHIRPVIAGGVVLVSLAVVSPAQAASGPTINCDGQWHKIRTVDPAMNNGDYNSLVSVSALSPSDAWAVGIGDDFDAPQPGYRTLAEHWDGSSWSGVLMPDSTKTTWNQMNGVAAISSDDVWAVGNEGTSPYGSLIEHWDGRSWTIQHDGTPDTYLTSVSGLGPDDVWAAGSTNYVGTGLIQHWDGTAWTRTLIPGAIYFRAIQELAPNDIWAVGQQSTVQFLDLTVAVHWDGSTWTRFATPNPLKIHSEDENWLTSVTAVAPNDVWA